MSLKNADYSDFVSGNLLNRSRAFLFPRFPLRATPKYVSASPSFYLCRALSNGSA
nr:MAG TPA: hypothetical protein [Caudoviricetes sp.]